MADDLTFAGLVRDHWDAVYRLLQSLTGDVHDTEDLAQETFLRAWGKIKSYRPGTNLRSWLLKIASNAFLDETRRRKRSKVTPMSAEPMGGDESPGAKLEVAEMATRVREAMQELSELTRMVFHLRATEDLSFREIAQIAGTTEQAARWHKHHARTRILEILSEPPASAGGD